MDTRVAPYEHRLGDPGSVAADRLCEQAAALGIESAGVTVLASSAYADLVAQVWPRAERPQRPERGGEWPPPPQHQPRCQRGLPGEDRWGMGLWETVAGLLHHRRQPDQHAVLCSVAEATSPDGQRHVVEEYGSAATAAGPGWWWVVRTVYGRDGARLSYASARYKAPGSRGYSDIKGALALDKACAELARHGSVIHRRPCPNCRLGIWAAHSRCGLWQHAATDRPECPDRQGTDCNSWSGSAGGFGDFQPWPRTGSCH